MKATKLPIILPSTAPPARKVSAQNLDVLYNSLVLMLNLNFVETMTPDLIAILTSMHNQLVARLDIDATDTIKLYKLLALYFLFMVRGRSDPSITFKAEDWSILDKCPTLFKELKPWYKRWHGDKGHSNKEFWLHVQVIYAFLSGHRVIVTPLNPNLATITAPSALSEAPKLSEYHENAMKRLGITPTKFQNVYESFCSSAKVRVVNTAGPNGQATWTAHLDAQALISNKSLFSAFKTFADQSKLSWITTAMIGTVTPPESLYKKLDSAPIHSRLHAIEEWGGKTRIVAIMDYWTQMLLTPLHDTIAHFLKMMPNDGTFDQLKIIKQVKDWTNSSDTKVFSYDLTAATDRLPISIQRDLIFYLTGDVKLADAWRDLMTNREFQAPDGTFVKYTVGQPMGAKSSFPMLGLIHHFLVQIAAIESKVTKFKDYVILGDDMTVANELVGDAYIGIMAKIGVPINMEKSVVSSSGLLTAGEICKRIFVAGRELTALPVKLIVKTQKLGHLAPSLQNIFTQRDWPGSKDNFLQFVAGLVDTKSLQGLMILNSVNGTTSGLSDPIDVSLYVKLSDLYKKDNPVSADHFEQAFLFALITEQLKRVDSLLKGTIVMAETIAAMANPDPAKVWPTALFEGLSEVERNKAIAGLPTLTWTHPICLAAQGELDRVLSHLSGLRSGTDEMVKKARAGLLDILRNSLHEMWLGEAERTAAVQRSVFNVALSNMTKITEMELKGNETRTLNFSILLTNVQRMWTVSWTFGSKVYLNAVKARVNISSDVVKSKVSNAFTDFKLGNFRL